MPAESVSMMTAEELESVHLPGKSTELVRGRLIIREPPGIYHGKIAAKLAVIVGSFVYAHDLGDIFGQDTGFKIASDPDTVRGPDFAFLRRERAAEIRPRGYGPFAPDLVVEIVSPDDRPGEVLAKVGEWLDAGVRLVWVIDPQRSEAHVHRPDGRLQLIGADGAIDGEDVIPGFSCPLSRLFA
jgi:Uma2 family endonuclease